MRHIPAIPQAICSIRGHVMSDIQTLSTDSLFTLATIGNCKKDLIVLTMKRPGKRENHGLRLSLVQDIIPRSKSDKRSDQKWKNI